MLIRALMAATVVTLSAVPFPCSAKDAPEVEALLLAMQGTLTVSSQPHLTDGKLTGCTLVYDALYQDWTYRGGRFLKVAGNIGFMSANSNMGQISRSWCSRLMALRLNCK